MGGHQTRLSHAQRYLRHSAGGQISFNFSRMLRNYFFSHLSSTSILFSFFLEKRMHEVVKLMNEILKNTKHFYM